MGGHISRGSSLFLLLFHFFAGEGFAAGHDSGVRRLHVLRHQRAARPPQPLRALPRGPQHRVRRRLSVRHDT